MPIPQTLCNRTFLCRLRCWGTEVFDFWMWMLVLKIVFLWAHFMRGTPVSWRNIHHVTVYQRCFPLAKRQFSREPPLILLKQIQLSPQNQTTTRTTHLTFCRSLSKVERTHLDCVNRLQGMSNKWIRGFRAGDWKTTRKGSVFLLDFLIWFKEHIRFRQKSTIYERKCSWEASELRRFKNAQSPEQSSNSSVK